MKSFNILEVFVGFSIKSKKFKIVMICKYFFILLAMREKIIIETINLKRGDVKILFYKI